MRLTLWGLLFSLCLVVLPATGCGQPYSSQMTSPAILLPNPISTVTPTVGNQNPTPTFTVSPTLSPTPSLYPPSDGVTLHTMDIVLNYLDHRMQVAHTVLLGNQTGNIWQELVFSVPPASTPGVFILQSAEVTTLRQRKLVTTSFHNTMLHVLLPDPILPGEPVKLYMNYILQIPSVTPTTWLPEGNLGAGDYVIQAGDWHPALVPYIDNVGWHTWEYHAVGDPTVYEIANFNVRISADPNLVIAAPGMITKSGSERYFQINKARSFAFSASPEYQVIETSVDGIPVLSFYLPPYAEEAQVVIDTASQAIPFFSSLYGPYPTTGLVIAQNAYYGSMEYTGFISMSDFAYRTYQETPTTLLVNLTAHEIAHQWWYGAVGNDQVYEPWLDEAFAKYSEVLFYERYYPEVVQWWWENHIDHYNPGGFIDLSIYEFETTADYIHQIYSQSACFMRDLRILLGDTQFFNFVKAYRMHGQNHLVTREDFFSVLKSYTDEDLTSIVERYFHLEQTR